MSIWKKYLTRMRLVSTRLANGRLTTTIYNMRGIEVAKIEDHLYTGEELETAARAFRDENPELFGDEILIDTAEVSQEKNPGEFGEGGLATVPGG